MATHYIKDKSGRVNTIITVANIYRYKGFTFEFHKWLGPQKCRGANHEPAAKMGPKFFAVIAEWQKLTEDEKLETQILG